jgi:hypothetical protein
VKLGQKRAPTSAQREARITNKLGLQARPEDPINALVTSDLGTSLTMATQSDLVP